MRYGLAGIAVGERGKAIRKRLAVAVPGYRGGGDELRLTLDLPDGVDIEAGDLIAAIERPLRTASSLGSAIASARTGLASILKRLPPESRVELEGTWPDPACVQTARWSGTVKELAKGRSPAGGSSRPSRRASTDDAIDFDVESTMSG